MFFADSEILYIITCTLLLLIALIVSFKKKDSLPAPRFFLAVYFWCYFWAASSAYLVIYDHIENLPHLFRTGFCAWLLFLPSSYMYISLKLFPRRLRFSDLLHILPAMLYLVDYFPFFLKSGAEKLSLYHRMTPEDIRIAFNEGWFMPKFGYHIIWIGQIVFYCAADFILLLKVRKSTDHPVLFENRALFSWIRFLVISQAWLLIIPIITPLFSSMTKAEPYYNLTNLLVAMIQCYFLIMHPQILYGYPSELLKHDIDESAVENIPLNRIDNKRIAAPYSDAELNEIGPKLEEWMQNHRPYLQSGYQLTDLSADTGITIHRLSAFINTRKKLNFYGYMNQFRINHYLEKIAHGEQRVKTLEALALECGFNSRSTFIRAFKSITGFTPSEYLEQNSKKVTGN